MPFLYVFGGKESNEIYSYFGDQRNFDLRGHI